MAIRVNNPPPLPVPTQCHQEKPRELGRKQECLEGGAYSPLSSQPGLALCKAIYFSAQLMWGSSSPRASTTPGLARDGGGDCHILLLLALRYKPLANPTEEGEEENGRGEQVPALEEREC